jgi:hypothetical protein
MGTSLHPGRGPTQRRDAISLLCFITASLLALQALAAGAEVLPPPSQRFVAAGGAETPDFRRHVVPLFGRLGCNGRACHGSFQGKGGFRLSLFGYDFRADHEALTSGEAPRADARQPAKSLMLYKPTHEDEHGGGQRMEVGSWQYNLLRRWIEAGARGADTNDSKAGDTKTDDSNFKIIRLEATPAEIVFDEAGQSVPLRIVASWSDGSIEDVTPLCRYQINDEAIAEVSADGLVTNKDRGDTHVIAFYDSTVAAIPVLRPLSDIPGGHYPAMQTPTKIDELIVAKLRKLRIIPAELCTDAEFLRRVSIDLTGTLPTPQEIESFVADPSAGKRTAKIAELLRGPTYVARWTTKLCELTGNSPRQFEDQAPPSEYARNWYEWIARRVRENVPYDELMAGIVLGRSRQPGQGYLDYITEESAYYRREEPADFTARATMPYYWAKHTSRTPEERAQNLSYALLGVRIECAQCHKHPFDRWTQADFQSFTAIFDRVGFGVAEDGRKAHQELLKKLGDQGNQAQRVRARLLRAQKGEIVPWEEVFLSAPGTRVEKGKIVKHSEPVQPRVLGGEAITLSDGEDPRQALVAWMRRPDNPYFARVFVNRVWAEYFGVGIIHPPDDLNLANPPSNTALLDYLTAAFIDHGFDMKWLHGEIASSHAYQRAIRSNTTNRLDERNFSRAVARRLSAEAMFDAIEQATGSSAKLAAADTELEERAIGPKGGAFVGRYGYGSYASAVFGRSPRNANCDCSASNEPNLLQAIYTQNDKDLLAAIERKEGWLHEIRPRLAKASSGEIEALIRESFLRTVSRLPSAAELERAQKNLAAAGDPVEGFQELLWALLNSREFLTNH